MKLATVMLASTALCVALSTGTLADTNDKKIAFSNNYAGNSWRQAMLKSYDVVTKKAVADKRRRARPTSSPPPTRKCRPRPRRSRT